MNDQFTERLARSSLVLCLSFVAAACGGGSSADSSLATAPLPVPVQTGGTPATTPNLAVDRLRRNPPPPVPTPTPVPPPVPVPPPTPTGADANCGLNGAAGIQAEVLQRVNAFRAAGAVCGTNTYAPAAALNWNSMLLAAATGHASDMAKNNYFSHNSLDGTTFDKRITATGYIFSAAGENIAAGQTTVQSVITAWINSPGHCQNMMNPSYRDIGVACVRNDAATYRYYWTMDLGLSQ